MSKTKKEWITNWLVVDETSKPKTLPGAQDSVPYQIGTGFRSLSAKAAAKNSLPEVKKRKKTILSRKRFKFSEVEETELTKSPISGTYILKEWKGSSRVVKTTSKEEGFSKDEVNLNKIAASFVQITPQARAKLAKIPNKIGPYECKLCKVVYADAFQLAMHNCPRVVCIEYK